MIRRFTMIAMAVCALLLAMSCATPTAAPTPTPFAATPTIAPTPASATVADNCVKCHSDRTTLEKLVVKTTEKSEETQGEG